MPRGRRPDGEKALSNAQRQARHRANRLTTPVEVITRPRRPTDRRSRPQRWRDAVKELLDLQATYADWLATLPDGLRTSRMAEALEAMVDLDLTELAECQPPPWLWPRLEKECRCSARLLDPDFTSVT